MTETEATGTAYSLACATLIAEQMKRFVTLNAYQLAGQFENLDFWISEANHALKVIDDYEVRFRRMKDGQAEFVEKFEVTVPLPSNPQVRRKPSPPMRISNHELQGARQAITDAAYRFLIRLYTERMIDEARLTSICQGLNVNVDPVDLKLKRCLKR